MDIKDTCNLINGEKREIFEKYYNLLMEANKSFNITSICDKKEVFIKHFIDSAAPEKLFKNGANVLEVGSGGGFPSLPLKILREDLTFTLVESTGKKCNFLKEAVDKLGLGGVNVLNSRAEDLAREVIHREKYDAVCARAVARLNSLCEYCLPFVKIGGSFIAYKGECKEELQEAAKAIEILGGKIALVEAYSLPDGFGERTVIVVEKIKPTPVKYPRGRGLERKKPIV